MEIKYEYKTLNKTNLNKILKQIENITIRYSEVDSSENFVSADEILLSIDEIIDSVLEKLDNLELMKYFFTKLFEFIDTIMDSSLDKIYDDEYEYNNNKEIVTNIINKILNNVPAYLLDDCFDYITKYMIFKYDYITKIFINEKEIKFDEYKENPLVKAQDYIHKEYLENNTNGFDITIILIDSRFDFLFADEFIKLKFIHDQCIDEFTLLEIFKNMIYYDDAYYEVFDKYTHEIFEKNQINIDRYIGKEVLTIYKFIDKIKYEMQDFIIKDICEILEIDNKLDYQILRYIFKGYKNIIPLLLKQKYIAQLNEIKHIKKYDQMEFRYEYISKSKKLNEIIIENMFDKINIEEYRFLKKLLSNFIQDEIDLNLEVFFELKKIYSNVIVNSL